MRRPVSAGVISNFTGTTSPRPPSVTRSRAFELAFVACRAFAGRARDQLDRHGAIGQPLGLQVAGDR